MKLKKDFRLRYIVKIEIKDFSLCGQTKFWFNRKKISAFAEMKK